MSEPSLSPTTASELVQFIQQIAIEYFKITRRSMTGALLANRIRARYPQLSYQQIGLQRLSDAVHLAEKSGWLVRRKDVSHLEVLPGPAAGIEISVLPHSQRPPLFRRDIWKAFVFFTPATEHFFDRLTGTVRSLNKEYESQAVLQLQSDSKYVRIQAISTVVQQGWAREFVEEQTLGSDAPIDVDSWWTKFPAWLLAKGEEATKLWGRFRAQRIVEHIKAWAASNGVSIAPLLAPPVQTATLSTENATGPSPISQGTSGPTEQASELLAWKKTVIAAISQMSFEELDALPIAIKHIRQHLRPR